MALTDYKITDGDVATHGVQSAPDKLTGTAAQNKARFDRLIVSAVKVKLNGLIDALVTALAAKLDKPATTGVTGQYLKTGASGLEWDTPGGSGDMLKSVYDSDGDGVVDTAEACSGNAATATKLKTARSLTIKDADESHASSAVSFDGSGDKALKLPETIKADLIGNVTGNIAGNVAGNAATASKLAVSRSLGGADFDGSADITLEQMGAAPRCIPIVDVTANRTIETTDACSILNVRASSAITITLPSGLDVPVGTQIKICRYYGNEVTLTAAAGVYLYAPGQGSGDSAQSYKLPSRYSVATITKLFDNRWVLEGVAYALGTVILSEDSMGTAEPAAGTANRLFFVKES